VRQVFNVRGTAIAGCIVKEGKVTRGAQVRVLRGAEKLIEAKIESLKRFKDDASEVEKGFECGIGVAGFKAFQTGDVLEFFIKEKRVRRLESAAG
jgi:translation initiation factor IF-2